MAGSEARLRKKGKEHDSDNDSVNSRTKDEKKNELSNSNSSSSSKLDKKECKRECNKGCCCRCLAEVFVVVLLIVLSCYQFKELKKAEVILNEINDDHTEMCKNYKHQKALEKPRFSQKDLLRYFAVTFEGGERYESEWLENFINSQNIYKEERYTNDEAEMRRRESVYGPYIENGFKDDDRFYIKLSSPEVGYGLYAKTDIPAGSVIGVYGGRLVRVQPNGVTDTDYAWSYQNYQVEETNETFEICIDGRVYGTWLRFVNHKHDSEANLYGMYVPYKNRWYLLYMSRNFIAKDEELFTSYGDFYWDARKETHHYEAEPDQIE